MFHQNIFINKRYAIFYISFIRITSGLSEQIVLVVTKDDLIYNHFFVKLNMLVELDEIVRL